MTQERGITQAMVSAAADAIAASGQRPTARSVRASVGGGSMNTVLTYLQAWQADRARTPVLASLLPVPLQHAIADFVAQEKSMAKASCQADLDAANQTIRDLMDECSRYSEQADAKSALIDRASEIRGELNGRIAQMEAELLRLSSDLSVERQSLDSVRAALAKAEQSSAVAAARLEAMQDRATRAEEIATCSEKTARIATQEASNCRLQIQAQQTALDAAVRETADLRLRIKETKSKGGRDG